MKINMPKTKIFNNAGQQKIIKIENQTIIEMVENIVYLV